MPPRRQPTTRTGSARTETKTKNATYTSPDRLATALASSLVISDTAGSSKRIRQVAHDDISPEARCLIAMRAVNAASKRLSGMAADGWRQTGGEAKKGSQSVEEVTAMVKDAAVNLNLLRSLKEGDVDVERAASSVVGKLLSLELFDDALTFLMDMHDPLIGLYLPSFNHPSQSPPAYFITLPPVSDVEPTPSEVIISLLCSYFVHALSTFCALLRAPSPPTGAMDASTFVSAIHENSSSHFLDWLPYFLSDPARTKMVDSACTKLYSAFARTCSVLLSPPVSARRQTKGVSASASSATSSWTFRLRTFTLECLAHTSTGTVESEAFWGELGKAVAEYKDNDTDVRQTSILQSINRIVTCVGRREDSSLYFDPEKKRFRNLLDGWLTLARAANDTTALKRISNLLGSNLHATQSKPQDSLQATSLKESKLSQAQAIRVYTLLTRIEALLAQDTYAECSAAGPSTVEEYSSLSAQAISQSSPFLSLSTANVSNEDSDIDATKIALDKVRRAFERMRRSAAKRVETSNVSQCDPLSQLARQILDECAATLETVLTEPEAQISSMTGQALLLSWLDTLFVLSKTTLILSQPDSYNPTFDCLQKGWIFFKGLQSRTSFANPLRILSGAFYSLAGSLYRGGKYAHAIRFLDCGCTIGAKALEARHERMASDGVQVGASHSQQSDQEAWNVLVDGLYKRWEVLGVCYSKTGDRKLAYQAFLEAVKAYPFSAQPFVDVAQRTPASLLFSAFQATSTTLSSSSPFLSPAVLQLGVLIDRITYMGVCELFLDPEDISLRPHFAIQNDMSRIVVGALIERQILSLESSRYKPNVKKAIFLLLQDALDVYQPDGKMPLRRAGIQLRWLEETYFGGTNSMTDQTKVNTVGTEVQRLLSEENFSLDIHIVHLRSQYQIMLHLWLALHIHRSGNTTEYAQIAEHSETACKVMKAMLHIIPRSPRASLAVKSKLVSPKQIVAPAKKAIGRSATKVKTMSRTRATRVTAAPPITPKPKKVPTSTLLTEVSPSTSRSIHAPLAFDGFAKLCDLLQTVSQLLGLLGYVVIKVHILNVTRRLCERYVGTNPEDFVQVSLDLGNEYVKLGKTERAATVYTALRNYLSTSAVPEELKALYFLRYAELLGTVGNTLKGASTYCEATGLLKRLDTEDDKAMSTIDRVNNRVTALERVAVAATSFAILQYSKDDPTASLNGLLQALRLYHRAIDTFARLSPPSTTVASDNPFDMSNMKETLDSIQKDTPGHQHIPAPDTQARKTYAHRSSLSSLEWRIVSGLLATLFSLAQAYLARGSPREAEYFISQAKDLAESLNASAMICRALTRLGELKLGLGKVDEARECLREAASLVEGGVGGVDAVDLRRLKGELSSKLSGDEQKHARASYEEAMQLLENLDDLLTAQDNSAVGLRKSFEESSRSSISPQHDSLMPWRFVAVLRRNIALLHGAGEEYRALLDRLRALPTNLETKTEENSLFAKLALEDAYARFRADMLLGSLAESTITLPIGITGEQTPASATTQEILGTLSTAEKLFWSDLALVARRGRVSHVRDAVVSLALIKAFQTSLGQPQKSVPTLTAGLLDSSAAITLRREMLEVIQHKFVTSFVQDDMRWPLITSNGSVIQPSPKPAPPRSRVHEPRGRSGSLSSSMSEASDDIESASPKSAKVYWEHIVSRYNAQLYDPSALRKSQTSLLPSNWSVISITLTSDQKALFITRQRKAQEPLIFCIPLKGRRENDDDDENVENGADGVVEGGQMGYAEVIHELDEVIRLSDEGTRGAVNVDKNDKNARAKWWKERSDLDKRLKTLLENVEFCWLGAFKTILSEPTSLPSTVLASFRSRLEHIFVRTLLPAAPTPLQSRPKHKAKNSSTSKSTTRLGVTLSDTLLETFASLPSTAPSEEIEDLAYFILDLYAFHGGPNMGVVVAEVDMDVLVLDIRGALEEVSTSRQKYFDRPKETGVAQDQDHHTFLVLDKNVQAIPWECIPVLRGRSVSRIPSVEFLVDRILWAKYNRGEPLPSTLPCSESASEARDAKAGDDFAEDHVADALSPIDKIVVDPTSTFIILNPSGDLKNTEGRFLDWVSRMQKGAGWEAIVGRAPSESEMSYALGKKDLVIYFGHGGAEQYIRSHKIRHLERCAATMLWGCSSGTLKEMGEFDRVGTPLNYVMAGCPTLVANLWDVTDRDIDKYSQAVFDKMHLTEVADVKSWRREHTITGDETSNVTRPVSIVRAISESRDACKLKYLTGAAPVVYGIPFYL